MAKKIFPKVVDLAKLAQVNKNEIVTDLLNLSDTQRQRVRDIKAEGGKAEVTKCRFCGKFLVRDISVEQEAGDLCEKLHEQYSTESLMAHRATMSATAAPQGYIKVADLHKICVRADIPVNRMVNAIGRDRGLSPAIDPRFTPIYVGNCRWVDAFCATKAGLAMIAGSKPTKQQKIKAELAALDSLADAVA